MSLLSLVGAKSVQIYCKACPSDCTLYANRYVRYLHILKKYILEGFDVIFFTNMHVLKMDLELVFRVDIRTID